MFRVALDKEPAADVTLNYTLGPDAREGAHGATPAVGGSCADGEDYLGATGEVVIMAPLQEATFEVQTCEDVLVERDETFWVGLSRGGGEVVVPAGTGAHGTIRNDDVPVVSVSPATVEGTEGDRLAFTVSLSVDGGPAQLSEDMTVAYGIGGGGSDPATAPGEPGADYGVTLDTAALGSTLQGTLSFTAATPGTEHVFEVELLADHLLEDPETFVLRLSDGDPSDGWTLPEAVATGTILDDAPPVLSVDDFTGPEGTTQTFTITLSGARAGETVTVDYEIVGGPGTGAATAPGSPDPDFEPVPSSDPLRGVLTFSPGVPDVVERTIDVSLLHDTLIEGPEELRLMLSSPSQAVLFDRDPVAGGVQAYGVGTIENVDPPVLSVDGFTGPEGTTQTFTITLSDARAGETVTVDYAISGGPGPGAATAPGSSDPADFEPVPDTGPLTATVTFSYGVPGQANVVERTVDVSLLADYVPDEGDETLRLTLTNPSGAVLSGSDRDNIIDRIDGVGTIEDVDPPVLSVDDFTGREGTVQTFTITLSGARAGETVTVDYAITGGPGPGAASAPGSPYPDFEPVPDTGPLTATVTFGPGVPGQPDVVERTIDVSLLYDTLIEVDEELRLMLSSPSRAVLFDRDPVAGGVQAYGVGTIENVDVVPYLFVGNTSAREGETLTFTVALCDPVPGGDVAVRYQTRAHSAAAGRDFVAAGGTLSFPAAMAAVPVSGGCGAGVATDAKSQTVVVATLPDRVEESDEEVHLVLSGQPDDVALGKSVGVGRIVNVSAATVRVSDPAAVEGLPLVFTIELVDNDGNPAVITAPVTVYYATADRTATAGADYTPVPAAPGPCLTDAPPPGCPSVTFSPADNPTPANPTPANRRHPVSVPTTMDRLDEDDEAVALVLRLAAGTLNAGLGDSEGTGTIEDADPPTLRIDNVIVQEGSTATFTVTLVDSNGVETSTSEVVTVYAATEDGSATAGADYTANSQRLRIPVGVSSAPFDVVTMRDDYIEPPETFRVVLSAPSNVVLGRAVAVGTINPRCVNINIDDDENRPPTITVHDVVVLEYDRYVETISLSRPMCDDFSISTQYVSGGILGNASCPEDFGEFYGCGQPPDYTVEAYQSENLTISPFTYISETDDVYEGEEWFTTQVRWGASMPSHYHQGQAADWASGRVTIIDADQPPLVNISDASAAEGSPLVFFVEADKVSAFAVPLQYRTVPGSGTATAGDDYVATDWQDAIDSNIYPFFFSVVTVSTRDDGVDDGHDTFLVELRGRPGAELHAILIDTVAVGTILEGSLPTLSIDDAAGSEGGIVSFDVELSAPATQIITVDFATVEMRGPAAAEAGVDYQEVSGLLTFGVGQWRQTISVPALTDTLTEYDETFLVELSNPSAGVTLADPSAVGTITGEVHCVDITRPGTVAPTVTVSSPTVRESDRQITFVVSLSEAVCDLDATDGSHTVRAFEDLGGTARPGVDYYLPLTRAVFSSAGGTEVSLSFYLIDDDVDEPEETLIVNVVPLITGSPIWTVQPGDDAATLGGEAGGVIARGTILDDDDVSLSVAGDSGPEGGFLNFVIRLDGPSDNTVTVDYATEDATPLSAVAGADYRARSGTAVIAAGELSATVAVFAPQDRLDEDDETFLLRLATPPAAPRWPTPTRWRPAPSTTTIPCRRCGCRTRRSTRAGRWSSQ